MVIVLSFFHSIGYIMLFHDLLTKYLQQIDVLIITNWRHFRVLELRKLFCITFYEVTCLPACLPLCMYVCMLTSAATRKTDLIADFKQKDAITVVMVLNRYFYDEMDKYII
jgi:hypothetical protein